MFGFKSKKWLAQLFFIHCLMLLIWYVQPCIEFINDIRTPFAGKTDCIAYWVCGTFCCIVLLLCVHFSVCFEQHWKKVVAQKYNNILTSKHKAVLMIIYVAIFFCFCFVARFIHINKCLWAPIMHTKLVTYNSKLYIHSMNRLKNIWHF